MPVKSTSLVVPLLLAFLLASPISIHAEILNVPDDYETIQSAIDAAEDVDTVLVSPGEYVENINYNGKCLAVGSLFLINDDDVYVEKVIINGDSRASVVSIIDVEGGSCTLAGVTIKNGWSDIYGGGVYCRGSTLLISNCVIIENAAIYGGGICFDDSSIASLVSCIVEDNFAHVGGGIAILDESHVSISNCTLNLNSGLQDVGGIRVIDSSTRIEDSIIKNSTADWSTCAITTTRSNLELNRCVITGNGAAASSALGFSQSYVRLKNCTICNNSGVLDYADSTVFIINSIIYDNFYYWIGAHGIREGSLVVIGYSDLEYLSSAADTTEVHLLNSNIDVDPLFVDPGSGDYNLTEESPCVDRATPFFVWQGDTLVNIPEGGYNGFLPDMGAFESEFINAAPSSSLIPHPLCFTRRIPIPSTHRLRSNTSCHIRARFRYRFIILLERG